MKIKNILLLCACIFICAKAATHENSQSKKKEITITIWVHGSNITPDLILRNFFYHQKGMVNALQYRSPRYHARVIAEVLSEADPKKYQMENFYFYGWSGALCYDKREETARSLYLAILELKNIYSKKYPNTDLKIRIITHSHGGNVALNLCPAQKNDTPLIIDELIMLAAPVQLATKDLAQNSCFKKIYSFYSGTDLYQILDFQRVRKKRRTLKIYSERRFDEFDNVRQAKVKLNCWSLMHIEFLLKKFLRHLPLLTKELDALYDSLDDNAKKREKLLHIKSDRKGNAYIRTKVFRR
ncbi:MAG: hypothetical protein WD055_02135 [Candidatus Dependentiae bacterium]